MQPSLQIKWKLGGFVQRALDSLATPERVNLWGQATPEIEKAAETARTKMCALTYEFYQVGKAPELAKHASDERSHQFAGRLLQLALQAWPVQRRRIGMRAEVTPESQVAWHSLLEDLKTFFVGGSEAMASARDAIRTICDGAISGADVHPLPPSGTPNEPSGTSRDQGGTGQAEGGKVKRRRGRKPGSRTAAADTRLYRDWKAAHDTTGITKGEFIRERGLPDSALASIERGRANVKRKTNSGRKRPDESSQAQTD